MGSRDVPYSEEDTCDVCGQLGAFDFMGDCLCPKCSSKYINGEPDESD